jgi:putative effector of murein hydrolase LrgA (UPF0299 family)
MYVRLCVCVGSMCVMSVGGWVVDVCMRWQATLLR